MAVQDDDTRPEFPALTELSRLVSEGDWTFAPRPDADAPVLGVREGPAVTEVLVIRTEDDTTVARLRTRDWMNQEIRAPLWSYTGELGRAINELRANPPI